MDTSRFYKLLKNAEVEYDGSLAVIEIRSEKVVIDVYMWNEDEELQIEECSFELTDKQKKVLTNKINKAISEQKEEDVLNAFTQDDYFHFENLIYA